MKDEQAGLVYQAPPSIDRWFRLVIAGSLGLTLVLGCILAPVDTVGSTVLFAVTVAEGLLFWCVIPREFRIYRDRVTIELGGPFSVTASLENIREVRKASGYETFAAFGLRFATSTSGVLEIIRRKGLSLIITPAEADAFLQQLEDTRLAFQEQAGHAA